MMMIMRAGVEGDVGGKLRAKVEGVGPLDDVNCRP